MKPRQLVFGFSLLCVCGVPVPEGPDGTDLRLGKALLKQECKKMAVSGDLARVQKINVNG
jgi:hypothetical protein